MGDHASVLLLLLDYCEQPLNLSTSMFDEKNLSPLHHVHRPECVRMDPKLGDMPPDIYALDKFDGESSSVTSDDDDNDNDNDDNYRGTTPLLPVAKAPPHSHGLSNITSCRPASSRSHLRFLFVVQSRNDPNEWTRTCGATRRARSFGPTFCRAAMSTRASGSKHTRRESHCRRWSHGSERSWTNA